MASAVAWQKTLGCPSRPSRVAHSSTSIRKPCTPHILACRTVPRLLCLRRPSSCSRWLLLLRAASSPGAAPGDAQPAQQLESSSADHPAAEQQQQQQPLQQLEAAEAGADAGAEPVGCEQLAPEPNKAAALQYAAVAAVHVALALALASAAPAWASALSPRLASPELLLLLLGCLAASQLRAAALALFLREGAARGELFTLRYQRVNAALAAWSATCLLVHLTSWGGASQLLLLLGAAVSAGTLAVAALRLRDELASERGIVSTSGFGFQGPAADMLALAHYLIRDLTSLAGALLWLLVPLGLLAFGKLVFAADATAAASGVAEACDPAAQYLRKLLGAGGLLLACLAHSLAEWAQRSRQTDTLTQVKLRVVETLQQAHPHAQLLELGAARFLPLSAGLAASMALQAWALWQGQALGVNVNGDDILWALHYWSVLLSGLLAPVLLKQLDWASVGRLVFGAADAVAKGIGAVVSTFFYNWDWAEGVRR